MSARGARTRRALDGIGDQVQIRYRAVSANPLESGYFDMAL